MNGRMSAGAQEAEGAGVTVSERDGLLVIVAPVKYPRLGFASRLRLAE
jgi:hypothetical protein